MPRQPRAGRLALVQPDIVALRAEHPVEDLHRSRTVSIGSVKVGPRQLRRASPDGPAGRPADGHCYKGSGSGRRPNAAAARPAGCRGRRPRPARGRGSTPARIRPPPSSRGCTAPAMGPTTDPCACPVRSFSLALRCLRPIGPLEIHPLRRSLPKDTVIGTPQESPPRSRIVDFRPPAVGARAWVEVPRRCRPATGHQGSEDDRGSQNGVSRDQARPTTCAERDQGRVARCVLIALTGHQDVTPGDLEAQFAGGPVGGPGLPGPGDPEPALRPFDLLPRARQDPGDPRGPTQPDPIAGAGRGIPIGPAIDQIGAAGSIGRRDGTRHRRRQGPRGDVTAEPQPDRGGEDGQPSAEPGERPLPDHVRRRGDMGPEGQGQDRHAERPCPRRASPRPAPPRTTRAGPGPVPAAAKPVAERPGPSSSSPCPSPPGRRCPRRPDVQPWVSPHRVWFLPSIRPRRSTSNSPIRSRNSTQGPRSFSIRAILEAQSEKLLDISGIAPRAFGARREKWD